MSESNHAVSVKKEIIDAFDVMWGLHPAPVMLIKADREIVAVNQAGQELGIPTGIRCFQLTGNDHICDGCQGNLSLKDNTSKRSVAWSDKLNMFADTYWIPVCGEEGLFIHFGNDITEWGKEGLCG